MTATETAAEIMPEKNENLGRDSPVVFVGPDCVRSSTRQGRTESATAFFVR